MLLEATHNPIRFHFADGETIRLEPGRPVDLPNTRAQKVLDKAGAKVRVVFPPSDVVIEPASCRLVYWESMDGQIRQGVVTWLGKTREADGMDRSWVFIEGNGRAVWVHESRLRSRAAFEQQAAMPSATRLKKNQ